MRTMFKLLAIALFFPVLTGFDNPLQQPDQVINPKAASAPVSQPVPAAPEAAGTEFNWKRKPDPTPLAVEVPVQESTKEGVHSWETGANKSYLIPALEVPGFLSLLSAWDRVVYSDQREDGKRVYSSNFSSTWDHLRQENWVFDKDPFNVNQFAHPYQGATMYGLARSSGLGFWESAAYSNVGSFLWKMAGETDPPSINDMITTGNAGSLLGEALFRMAGLVLQENGGHPDTMHEIGAAIISPPTAFNRYGFGDRFKSVFPSQDPETAWRFQLGSSFNSLSQLNANLDFDMAYGLPGKPGYTYQRPLDYFDFEINGQVRASNPLNDVLLRGLLYGRDYQAGDGYRGIWGLYGSYDYLAPTVFRVSTTALSLGTTGQYWVAPGVALQGTVLGGVGFGAAGSTPVATGDRDYHYGVAPETLLALRLLFGHRAEMELDARGYYVAGTGRFISTSDAVDNAGGSEAIVRIKSGVTVRVFRRHGIGVQYVESIRESQYGTQPSRHQSDGTVSLVYTFLGDSHFGAVEWRDRGSQ